MPASIALSAIIFLLEQGAAPEADGAAGEGGGVAAARCPGSDAGAGRDGARTSLACTEGGGGDHRGEEARCAADQARGAAPQVG